MNKDFKQIAIDFVCGPSVNTFEITSLPYEQQNEIMRIKEILQRMWESGRNQGIEEAATEVESIAGFALQAIPKGGEGLMLKLDFVTRTKIAEAIRALKTTEEK